MEMIFKSNHVKFLLFLTSVILWRDNYIVNTQVQAQDSPLFKEVKEESIDMTGVMNNCAHFRVFYNQNNYTYSLDLLDREEFNENLQIVLDSEEYFTFESVVIQLGCEVKICVLPWLSIGNGNRKTVCNTLTANYTLLDPRKYYYIVTISCSCKPLSPELNETNSNSKCEEFPVSSSNYNNECARLYNEPYCKQCRYDYVNLSTTNSIMSTNGFSTESVIVREGCRMKIKSNSLLSNDSNFEETYTGVNNFIQLSYDVNQKPYEFTCTCDADNEKEHTLTPYEDDGSIRVDALNLILVTCIPIIVIITLAIGFGRYFLRFRLAEKRLELLAAKKAVERFENGCEDDLVEISISNPNYFSFGYTTALQIPYQTQFEVLEENLEIDYSRSLGDGHFGKVFCGKLKICDGKIEVAVKVSKPTALLTYFMSLLDEIKILTFVGEHQNIVRLIGACTQNIRRRDALIIFELCSKGSLKSYLIQNRSVFMNSSCSSIDIRLNTCGYTIIEPTNCNDSEYVQVGPEYSLYLTKWAKEIASAMEYLSLKQVVHSDLAARNILLTGDYSAKLADFGLSQRMHQVNNYVRIGSDCPMPIKWMALESLQEHRFSIETDVWSYGVLLWEMFSQGEDPHRHISSYADLLTWLNEGHRLEKPEHATLEIYTTMQKCWITNPNERPSFRELRLFFESLDCT